jgi:hypothetical protein
MLLSVILKLRTNTLHSNLNEITTIKGLDGPWQFQILPAPIIDRIQQNTIIKANLATSFNQEEMELIQTHGDHSIEGRKDGE